MQRQMRFRLIIAGCLSLCILGGCNKDPHLRKVTGTITYQGESVAEAAVQFYPVDDTGEPAAGKTMPNGHYVITAASAKNGGSGTKPGKYKVLVIKKEELPPDPLMVQLNNGEITYKEFVSKTTERKQPPPNSKTLKNLLPDKYATLADTPLEFTVEDKRLNKFDIELTD